MTNRFARLRLSIGVCTLGAMIASAVGEETGEYDEEYKKYKESFGFLEEIVITASSRDKAKLRTSLASTSLGAEDIANFAPRSEAEVFRNIPGIRAESTGGAGGNANIAVRGLPISTGGAKFLQLQEDGLPVVEFGDIAFGNNDIWIRYDDSVERVESIRGGSASTFVSNAPGGVINFISKTGEETGGTLGLVKGVDFESTRINFSYGTPVTDDLRFHLGGFYREGTGPRDPDYTANKGYQVKANVTREFNNGFVRLYVKRLDDRGITYAGLPMSFDVSGRTVKNLGTIAGFDAREDTIQSPLSRRIVAVGPDNRPIQNDVAEGIHPVSNSFGIRFSFDLGDGWQLDNKFKYADTRGSFLFPIVSPAERDQVIESIGGPGASARFANGPHRGQPLSDANTANGLLNALGILYTEMPDFSNFANDLSLSRSLAVMGGDLQLKLGFYSASQNIAMNWHWTEYVQEVRGNDAAFVDIFDALGNKITENGVLGYNSLFGACCVRSYDLEYEIDAPYVSADWELGAWNLDASIRYDTGDAGGTFVGGQFDVDGQPLRSSLDINGDGMLTGPEKNVFLFDTQNPQPVNYDWDYWSYSLGANYLITKNLGVFGRISEGARANADRLVPGPAISPLDGSLADDDAAVDVVSQYEFGVKYRSSDHMAGELDVFATFFFAEVEESNFELTTQRTVNAKYEAKGVELEAAYQLGDFLFKGNITYTDAEIVKDLIGGNAGNTPRASADWIYSGSLAYTREPFTVGVHAVGQSKVPTSDGNTLYVEGYYYLNLFAYYDIVENLTLGLNSNNVTNEFGAPGLDQSSIEPGQTFVSTRPEAGRSTTISITYRY